MVGTTTKLVTCDKSGKCDRSNLNTRVVFLPSFSSCAVFSFMFTFEMVVCLLKLPVLAALVETYVDCIRRGAAPCIENAITSMAVMENSRNVEEALQQYRTAMGQLKLPTQDDKTFFYEHGVAMKEAIKYFVGKAIFDKDHHFQTNLNVSVKTWNLQHAPVQLGVREDRIKCRLYM